MPTFNDIDSLMAYLRNDVLPDALGEAEDVVKDNMQVAIHREVYSAYDPVQYQRRMNNGGLSDRSNMRSHFISNQVNAITMVTENYAQGEHGYDLDGLIAYGHGSQYGEYEYTSNRRGDAHKYLQGRNFYFETMNMLEDNLDYIQAIRKGFRKRGIQVK